MSGIPPATTHGTHQARRGDSYTVAEIQAGFTFRNRHIDHAILDIGSALPCTLLYPPFPHDTFSVPRAENSFFTPVARKSPSKAMSAHI